MSEDDPSPVPDPALLNRQPKWFKPVLRIVVWGPILFFLLVALATFDKGMIFRQDKKARETTAISNVSSMWYPLIGFNEEFGSFPNEETAARVAKEFPTDIDLSGSSSNALFRQLFVSGQVESEQIFFAKIPGALKPDGIITTGEALKKGECGFSYITGLSSKDDPTSPLVLTPLIPGTTKFDPKPFGGRAVVLQIDKSVQVYEIQKDGHIYDKGIDLLSPKHPVWNGKAPDIRHPEL